MAQATEIGGIQVREPARPLPVAIGAALLGRFLPLPEDPRPLPKLPINASFLSPNVTKGMIVTQTNPKFVKRFMFNPNTVRRSDGWKWGMKDIAALSHQLLNGGSGAPRTTSFSLYVDGDRGRSSSRAKMHTSRTAPPQTNPRIGNGQEDPSLDITDEVNFFRALTLPDDTDGIVKSAPPTLILVLGPSFPGVVCVMSQVEVEYTQFLPSMAPVKAVLNVTFTETIDKSVGFSSVMPSSFAADPAFDPLTASSVTR